MDVAIVIGHHEDAPGAVAEVGSQSVTEHALWSRFAPRLVELLTCEGVKATTVDRPNEQVDSDLLAAVNRTGADCAIELHFNASVGSGWGTEMIHWPGSEEGKRLATLLQAETVGALGLRDRGTSARKDLRFLGGTSMPAVIAEPFFGSDEEDAVRGLTGLPSLLNAYQSAIIEYLQ